MRHKKNWIRIIATLLFILLGAWLFAFAFSQSTSQSMLEMLDGVAEQNKLILQREVDHVLTSLQDVRAYMMQGDGDLDDRMRRLKAVDQQNSFKRMGIITADGVAHCTDGAEFNASDRDYFRKAIVGESAFSDTLVDRTDGGKINVCSLPLQMADGSDAVFFAVYGAEQYAKVLSAPSFSGAGYSFVVKQDGTCVVTAKENTRFGEFENLFDTLSASNDNAQAVEQLQEGLEEGTTGTVLLEGNDSVFIHYERLDVNDWYLMTAVPQSVAIQQTTKMLALAYGYTILCAGTLILLTLYTVRLRDGSRKALEDLAYVDPITQKATQARFLLDVKETLQKHPQRTYALLMLDLEKFQYINDLFGYDEGDNALRFCSDAIHDLLKDGEHAARTQADQFALLWQFQGEYDLLKRVSALQEYLSNCTDHGGKHYTLRFSVGVCGTSADESLLRLLDCANLALQEAKQDAVRQVVFYDESMRQDKMLAKSIGDAFEESLAKGEFIPWFQPKYNVKEKRFDGAEALVRWQTADGMISPGAFVPVLEQNGGIRALDRHVFESVCSLMATWRQEGLPLQPISVNISRLHLYDMDFVTDYLSILKQYELSPHMIQLELTETVLFNNEGALNNVLGQLREEGIQLQMDDFGAGYSSIKMMMEAPIDVLKIDKALVDACEQEQGRNALKAITSLAHTMGLRVTAEGVETEAQYHVVEQVGCDWVQGYYCSRPMSSENYEKLLREQACSESTQHRG